MKEQPYREDREEFRELLQQYENLKSGRSHHFLEEESFERIIEYFDSREEFLKALEAAEIACDQFPYSAPLLVQKADVLLSTRRYEDALQVLDQAALLDSRDINLFILKTETYLALDRQEEAIAQLEEALQTFEGDERIDLLFELADVYDDYEEFDKIFDCLKLILEDQPNNEEALYKVCFWTDFTGRNEESIRLHMNIIDRFPYNELAWFNLGAAYQGIRLYEKAIDAYQYAVAIDEKFDYAYRNMGDAFIRLRKYREAIESLERVLELSKPEDVIYEAIGHCYDRLKNFAQARFHYRKASHLNQEDSKLVYKIACTYYNEQQWNQAIRQLENILKTHRLNPDYNLLMGECYVKAGIFKEAIHYFSNVVRIRPKNVAGWEALIRCLYRAEIFEEALEQVHAALQVTDGKPLFQYYHSAVLFRLGKSKEALIQLENALSVAPKLYRKFNELNPAILQNQQVVDLVARYKKKKAL